MHIKILSLAAVLAMFLAISANAQIAVIANKNVDLTISANTQALDIFTLDVQKSKTNVPLVIFDLKSGDSKDKFVLALGKTTTELKKIWMKAQLSGEGKAPESLDGEDAMLAKVASTPGAVGYIGQAKVTDAVKVLFVMK
jgi:hypothetical protein